MKPTTRITLFIFSLFILQIKMFAWNGMPTPPLHVEGNKLIDPTGKNVLLHGWMQPTDSWFNGEGNQYSNPTDWTDQEDVAGMLNFLKKEATVMSDTGPMYGQDHGWYANFVRVNTDAVGGWTSEDGLVDTAQFDAWINNFLVPYVEHLESRGLYLILCATGPMVVNVNDDGARNASIETQSRLLTFWERVANAPGIKNANNVMFELMNEPVQIESSPGNGDWGSGSGTYFKAFQNWTQPIIDTIRDTGSNNVIWVPTLGWQGEPHGWAENPFSGSNIGVAAHFYPAYGGVHNDSTAVQNLWNSNYKPAADQWPMIITEMMWYPNEPGGYDDLFNGTTEGFGNAIKKAIDNQGNVSYLIGFIGDHLANLTTTQPADCPLGSHEGTQSYFEWLPEYTWAAPDDGTPEFNYASVTNENPNQINVCVSHAINKADRFSGFSVEIDNQSVGIDSITKGDTTNQLAINLSNSILEDSKIALSYNDGNVTSIYDKNLVNFSDTIVYNLLDGAPPIITKLKTNEDGDTLIAKFTKKMQIPPDLSELNLNAQYNGDMSIPILQVSFFDNDSTMLSFALDERIYADYQLSLSYSGNNIVSSDNSSLETFSDFPVTNKSKGLPVQIESGRLEPDGTSVILKFTKTLDIAVGQSDHFALKVNGESVPIKDFYISDNTVRFSPDNTLHHEDILSVDYTQGNITAIDQGPLESFSDFAIENLVSEPSWHILPGKVEAENYALQSGTDTEQTSDSGGGLNVNWIDDGNWLDYAIHNTSNDSLFEISFRVASPNDDCELEYYLDNKRIKSISVPNTGGWQTWQTVVDEVKIGQGKHYLKVVATSGGFNFNYLDIKQIDTSAREINNNSDIKIFPNPVSNQLIIHSRDFQYNKIEIIDINGKTVLSKSPAFESELHIPVNLPNGMYILKISNEKVFKLKKIIIKNH
ncbi:MAG: carbohydrate-binding protein [Bacteroidota bacterium]